MRSTYSSNLVMRDRAAAALMGAIGDDFGRDGSDFGRDWAFSGDDVGLEAPPATATVRVPNHPVFHPSNHGKLMEMWEGRRHSRGRRYERELLLDPNEGSAVKVERYSFGVQASLTLGTAAAIYASLNPETTIRPQRVIANAPTPGFVTLTDLKVANVSVIIGDFEDAYNYNANAVGSMLDMPTLEPANRLTVLGNYLGYIPANYSDGATFPFCVAVQGPSTMAG